MVIPKPDIEPESSPAEQEWEETEWFPNLEERIKAERLFSELVMPGIQKAREAFERRAGSSAPVAQPAPSATSDEPSPAVKDLMDHYGMSRQEAEDWADCT